MLYLQQLCDQFLIEVQYFIVGWNHLIELYGHAVLDGVIN